MTDGDLREIIASLISPFFNIIFLGDTKQMRGEKRQRYAFGAGFITDYQGKLLKTKHHCKESLIFRDFRLSNGLNARLTKPMNVGREFTFCVDFKQTYFLCCSFFQYFGVILCVRQM